MIRLRAYLTVLLALGALTTCARSGTQVTVVNQATAAIHDVVLSGSGWSASMPRIEPKSSDTITVHPRGESGLAIAFQSEGRAYSYPEQGYFEGAGSYRVTVTIAPDLTASVASRLK